MGWSLSAIAGMIGNMQLESWLSPALVEGTHRSDFPNSASDLSDVPNNVALEHYNHNNHSASGYGLGLVQWDGYTSTSPAGHKLVSFAIRYGLTWYDGDTQLYRIQREYETNIQWQPATVNGTRWTWSNFITNTETPETSAKIWRICYEVAASGNIVKGWKSKNNSGAAYIMSKGEDSFLVILNNSGYAVVYDTEKNVVTADHADLVEEAKTAFGTVSTTLAKAVTVKIKNLFGADAEASATRINDVTTFNTVSVVGKFTLNGETIYMFQSKPYTYGNNVMTVYTFINENGEIVKQETTTLIYDHYSQEGFNSNKDQAFIDWLDKYTGKTEDTLGDDLLIAGVTISSTAVKNATADAFAAFNSIKGGEQ